jgi:hypothetical protein
MTGRLAVVLHGVLGASARGPEGFAVRRPGKAEQLPPEPVGELLRSGNEARVGE